MRWSCRCEAEWACARGVRSWVRRMGSRYGFAACTRGWRAALGGLRLSVCTVVSPQAEGLCILTSVALKDRGAAQRISLVNINLSGRLIFCRSWEDVPPSANDTTSLLQRPQVGAFLHDAFRGRGLGVREKVRKGSGRGGEFCICGWLGWESLCADVESIGQVQLLLLLTSLWHWRCLIGLVGPVA